MKHKIGIIVENKTVEKPLVKMKDITDFERTNNIPLIAVTSLEPKLVDKFWYCAWENQGDIIAGPFESEERVWNYIKSIKPYENTIYSGQTLPGLIYS